MRRSKYRNCKIGGFDSKKELKRYGELKVLEEAGTITDLQRQVPFELVPHQIIDGKVVERAVKYFADFTYKVDGVLIVEDVKSDVTKKNPEYVIKRKLLLERYGIRIKEV